MTIRDSVDINAGPDKVFDAVSHLEAMGRYSPENTGGVWTGGATGPALGATFKGTNTNGSSTWSTKVTVTECEPPTAFTFDVSVGPFKVARWSYAISETATGSQVTESWIDLRLKLVKKLSSKIVADRETFTKESIRVTLTNLKAALES